MAQQPRTPSRLLDSLDRLTQARVGVVSGPAGHGKHALVDEWFAAHPEWRRLQLTSPEQLDQLTEQAHAGDAPLVAVVDTPAGIADDALAQGLVQLAERDPQLRALFVGRARPNVPLGNLAARGQLTDIDAHQLALTRDEVREALAAATPDLAEATVDNVMASTLGWPAVVRLFARDSVDWTHTGTVNRLADDYMAHEVLVDLDEDDRLLLRQLATLPEVDPQAANHLTGRSDAVAQLSRLQAAGLPIQWEDANVVRINPVLRGHLTRQLARTDPDAAREQTRRAAVWLRGRGRPLDAICLASRAGMDDLVWMLAGEFISRHMHQPVLAENLPRMVEMLPPGWEVDTVRALVRGMSAPQTMVAQLSAINVDEMVASQPTGRLGYAAFALGMVRTSAFPEDPGVERAVEIARSTGPKDVDELDLSMLATAATEYGMWLLHRGQLPEAQQQLFTALGLARVADTRWAVAETLSALALLHASQGAVATARQLADEAIAWCAENRFTIDSLDELALVARVVTALDTGDTEQARQWLDQLGQHRHQPAQNDAIRTWANTQYLLATEDAAGAQRLVGAYRDQPRPRPTPLHDQLVTLAAFDAALLLHDLPRARDELARFQAIRSTRLMSPVLLQARLALAEQDPEAAYRMLLPLVSEAELGTVSRAKETLYLLVLFGVAADELHRGDEAVSAFQRASTLAQRVGLDGPGARHTRVAAASRHDLPLTDAERHVLANLDEHRTLSETAEALFISLNTLKTHLRRIYRKLGVANRQEAVERARMMGIRPSE